MKQVGNISIRDCPGGAIIAVKVVPGASRDKIVSVLGDSLKIATSAPPEKGKANAAVSVILAKALGLDKQGAKLISGLTNPRKEFYIVGLSAQQVRQLLEDV